MKVVTRVAEERPVRGRKFPEEVDLDLRKIRKQVGERYSRTWTEEMRNHFAAGVGKDNKACLDFLLAFLETLNLQTSPAARSSDGSVGMLFLVGGTELEMASLLDRKLEQDPRNAPYTVYGMTLVGCSSTRFFKWHRDEAGNVTKQVERETYNFRKRDVAKVIAPTIKALVSMVTEPTITVEFLSEELELI